MKILWIPHASWATPQRARLFAEALADEHEVHVTDWVADFYSARDLASWRYIRNFMYRLHKDGDITVHGIPRISPAFFSFRLRRLNAAIFAAVLRRIIGTRRIDVVVGSFVAPPPEAPRLIFDMADDNVAYWRVYGRAPEYADEIASTEGAYLRKSDGVVVVSTVLAERVRGLGYAGPLSLIPNGVRVGQYGPVVGEETRKRLGLSGPIVGLIGNHDKRSEMQTVLEVASLISDTPATVLVIGRGAAIPWARQTAAARHLSNVRFIGFVPPGQIAGYFAAVDIGLCPYAKNAAADAASPMRLIAHAAAGSTIICTDLEEVRRMAFENVILVDNTPARIAAAIRTASGRRREQPHRIAEYDLDLLVERYAGVLAGEGPSRAHGPGGGEGRAWDSRTWPPL